MTDRAK